jgi:hypothetical protein
LQALFVDKAVPLAQVTGDSVLPAGNQQTMTSGACTLILPSGCPPPCGPGATFVDDGTVHLNGSTSWTLSYHADLFSYVTDSDVPPGATVFQPGERVHVYSDGTSDPAGPAFSGDIRIVAPLVLTAPTALPAASPFVVSWTPDVSDRVQISLSVTTASGTYSQLICEGSDKDGQLTLPDDLLAALPAPPRDYLLEVSRDNLTNGSAGDGRGVVIHSSNVARLTGSD